MQDYIATETSVRFAMIQAQLVAAVIPTSTPASATMDTTAVNARSICATNALMLVPLAALALPAAMIVSVPKVSPAGTVRLPLLKWGSIASQALIHCCWDGMEPERKTIYMNQIIQ